MKKTAFIFLSLVTAIFMITAESSHAAGRKGASYSRPYGMAGCGLGSILMGKKDKQLFAASTNGTFGQVFAITFGTSNCVDDPNAQVAMKIDQFVIGNKVALASDMARGSGETLTNLSAMMGCAGNTDQFGVAMQENFGQIFPSSDVHANEITDQIITAVKSNESLSSACRQII